MIHLRHFCASVSRTLTAECSFVSPFYRHADNELYFPRLRCSRKVAHSVWNSLMRRSRKLDPPFTSKPSPHFLNSSLIFRFILGLPRRKLHEKIRVYTSQQRNYEPKNQKRGGRDSDPTTWDPCFLFPACAFTATQPNPSITQAIVTQGDLRGGVRGSRDSGRAAICSRCMHGITWLSVCHPSTSRKSRFSRSRSRSRWAKNQLRPAFVALKEDI